MAILAVETSNKTLSVAILQHDKLIVEKTIPHTLQHSIFLAPAVEEVMSQANVTMQDLTAIALSNGPGSYTGLRIGVTFAKTLAHTLRIPVVPVSSLKVLANSLNNTQNDTINLDQTLHDMAVDKPVVISFFDARRGNVFIGGYIKEKNILPDCHINMTNYLHHLQSKNITPHYMVSPDIKLYEETIKAVYPNVTCLEVYPNAFALGQLMTCERIVHTHQLTPYYLKLAEAEENWLNTQADHHLEQWVDRGVF